MKNLNLYLNFDGNCEEALRFYQSCLGGKIEMLQRFGEAPNPVPEGAENRIMHGVYRAEGIFLMASDVMPGHPFHAGNNTHLSVQFDDKAEQHSAFEKLSAGGQITFPLQETFWGAEYGMLTDKFGINWMFNREIRS